MNQLDQGSILFGICSEKYPNTRCYGIIISASCDIANCKVPKLYYLIAVDAQEWFSTDIGYNQAYAETVKNLFNQLKAEADKHSLSATLLTDFTDEEFELIISSGIPKDKDQKKIRSIYQKYRIFSQLNMSNEQRKVAIRTDKRPIINFLEKVSKGEIMHFYYLPQEAYRKDGAKSKGLIIDLQEIEILPLKDVEMLRSPGIDYLVLPNQAADEQERLKKHYWLNNEDDFVASDGIISSPWREHLMQRFSHGFVRIGIDGATIEDYSQLANTI